MGVVVVEVVLVVVVVGLVLVEAGLVRLVLAVVLVGKLVTSRSQKAPQPLERSTQCLQTLQHP